MKSYLAAAKLLLLVLLRNDGECALNSTQMKNILDIYDTKKGDLIPRSTNGTFTTRLGFEILNMVPLTFINDHLYVEFGLIETWMDNRLKLTNEDSDEVLILQGDAVSAIWKPDISILNEKGVKHDTFPAIQESVSISLQGIVTYHISLRVTLSCIMSMERFPFDKQECPLNIESYGYNISSLRLGLINTTKDASVTISDSFKISKFILDRYKVEVKQIDYGVSGIFDKVVLTFFLKRDTRYYIMEYYFPIICTVFLSGVSFWINHRVTPARVALPVTTFLTLTSMLQHVRSSAELYGTANCLEIFLNVSNIFVIAVMIQFIFVGSTSRGKREVDKGEGCPARKETCNHASRCCSVLVSTFSRKRRFSVSQKKTTHSQPRIHPLDKIFRYLFPLSYVTFIIIYFIVFNLLL